MAAAATKRLERWKLWVALVAGGLIAAGLYVWPARRNYFGRLGDLEIRLDVPYLPGSQNPKQQLDVYLPRTRSGPFPVVVFVHGGYWTPLDRRWLQPLLGTHGNIGAAFARQGIGAAIVGYRQYPEVQRGDDSLDDIARAVRYVATAAPSWGGDPHRIILIGHSAGGHLVSLMAMDPRILRRNGVGSDEIAGFASLDGVFDLLSLLSYLKPEQGAVLRTLFGPDDAALADHSPITYARANHPPLLFVDSTEDEVMCLDGFRRMQSRLAATGSKAHFIELRGLGHNETIVRIGMDADPVLPTLREFVESTVSSSQ